MSTPDWTWDEHYDYDALPSKKQVKVTILSERNKKVDQVQREWDMESILAMQVSHML
jgi:hypothetical protein